MSIIEIRPEITVSLEEILQSVSKLETQDLEDFSRRIGTVLEKRKATIYFAREAELLSIINRPYPSDLNRRYETLFEKQEAENLTEEEQQELVRICDHFEELDAVRLDALMELARLKAVSLDALMQELHLTPPALAYA